MTTGFKGFSKGGLEVLRGLGKNNSKEYFDAHRGPFDGRWSGKAIRRRAGCRDERSSRQNDHRSAQSGWFDLSYLSGHAVQ